MQYFGQIKGRSFHWNNSVLIWTSQANWEALKTQRSACVTKEVLIAPCYFRSHFMISISCLRHWLSNSCEGVWSQNEIVQVCEVDHSGAHCDWQVIQILWYLELRELADILLSLNNAAETLNLAEAITK